MEAPGELKQKNVPSEPDEQTIITDNTKERKKGGPNTFLPKEPKAHNIEGLSPRHTPSYGNCPDPEQGEGDDQTLWAPDVAGS